MRLLAETPPSGPERAFLLAYPRMFGFVFNPINIGTFNFYTMSRKESA